MRRVIEVGQNGKKKREKHLKMMDEINSRIEVIQMLIPIGLQAVNNLLQWEVKQLVGERYERAGREKGIVRWGKQASSVYLADQKVLGVSVGEVGVDRAGAVNHHDADHDEQINCNKKFDIAQS